ncbi:hypothetical protein RHMOL_Rhmol11G0138700 [Rhododendron molle]|uniref:Uncharacterized protein n=3 Tax=Rhododendron molle TaxID=49168 RepID=A0ACC0LS33_RHOML|nr:hypothetical protein RHMOL_Rhmol11G0138700 [Rhododendron molle]KAI8531465.1 hypothetical protein RHMOL_Rhmol11G0138700 [Rhododendron molle]KAI8531466.1 hypothetical protein RHMOL_Rhmol11G0138700 [Rhododendron molle]
MVGREELRAEELDLCFDRLMVFGGSGGIGGTKMGGAGMITKWKDIPMELLLRIVSLVDERGVIVASGVCTGWRDAVCWGLTQLSLSWCKNNMNNMVLSLAPKFTKLQTLILRQDKPQLQDNTVEAIGDNCNELLSLNLGWLAYGCPDLRAVVLCGCVLITDDSVIALANNYLHLRSPGLYYCQNIKDSNVGLYY